MFVDTIRGIGSSPHTRGAHLRRLDGEDEWGIIPAYAGSTVMRSCCLGSFSDHPRIRGEHLPKPGLHIGQAGSSPHTRGARGQLAGRADDGRIIPAYAGSTYQGHPRDRLVRDHPRIRGEHALLRQASDSKLRIIPAYAGSTYLPKEADIFEGDHPRIRGEHEADDDIRVYYYGSSPHTRGAPLDRERCLRGARIIPAYAGSTTPARRFLRPGFGSSPHTRGAPFSSV